jgi:hypothetical protein
LGALCKRGVTFRSTHQEEARTHGRKANSRQTEEMVKRGTRKCEHAQNDIDVNQSISYILNSTGTGDDINEFSGNGSLTSSAIRSLLDKGNTCCKAK